MTPYLDLPLRSLHDLMAETEAEIKALECQQCELDDRIFAADMALRFNEADQCRAEYDAISDRLGPLLDRLDTLEEEIGWRSQAEDRRNSPIVL